MEEDEKTSNDTSDYYGSLKHTGFMRLYVMEIGSMTGNEREMEGEVKLFVQKIKNTDTYQNYMMQVNRVNRQPELKQKIDEFRIKNYELQTSEDSEHLLERMEVFEAEYETFRENPMVDDFLSAELQFCRMLQEIYEDISESVYFD